MQPIAVLGAGSWGTALALHLSRLGQEVRLWSFEADHVVLMQRDRANKRYLPTQAFPETLQPIVKLEDALRGVKDILIAVPSVGFHHTLDLLKAYLQPSMRIVWATKGLDEQTGDLLHSVALHVLGDKYPYAVLSGPSFAKEVAANLPTAVVVGSQNEDFAKDLQQRFNGPCFRVYLSHDMIGVEIGGVVKNILAIATGISDGMGFGANARSALITRGLAEMIRLGVALGGLYETFTGLAGVGDLVLTCTDDQSRNRRFGLLLGKGLSPEDAEKEIKQVVEGKRNTELVMILAEKMQVDMPIVQTVFGVLQGKLKPIDAMQSLFSRALRAE